jgi:hypothetical protein
VTKDEKTRIIIDDPWEPRPAQTPEQREASLRWFREKMPERPGAKVYTAGPFRVSIPSRLHTDDLSAKIVADGLGFERLCLPMEPDPEHPMERRRQRRKPEAVNVDFRLLQWAERTSGVEMSIEQAAELAEQIRNISGSPTSLTIPLSTYYQLRSPGSRVGIDGNFSGPTRKRHYTRRQRRLRKTSP